MNRDRPSRQSEGRGDWNTRTGAGGYSCSGMPRWLARAGLAVAALVLAVAACGQGGEITPQVIPTPPVEPGTRPPTTFTPPPTLQPPP